MNQLNLVSQKQPILNRTKFVVQVNGVAIGTLYNLNSGIVNALKHEAKVYRPYTSKKSERATEYRIGERELQYIHRSLKGFMLLLQDDKEMGGEVSDEELNASIHNVKVLRNVIEFCHTFGKKTPYYQNYKKHDIRFMEKKVGINEALKTKLSLTNINEAVQRFFYVDEDRL